MWEPVSMCVWTMAIQKASLFVVMAHVEIETCKRNTVGTLPWAPTNMGTGAILWVIAVN